MKFSGGHPTSGPTPLRTGAPTLCRIRGRFTKISLDEEKTPYERLADSANFELMNLILLLVVLLLVFGGGGFYLGGPAVGGGGVGLILLICLIVFLMGGFRAKS